MAEKEKTSNYAQIQKKTFVILVTLWSSLFIGAIVVFMIFMLIITGICEFIKYLGTKTHKYHSFHKAYSGVSEYQSKTWAKSALPRISWWCETLIVDDEFASVGDHWYSSPPGIAHGSHDNPRYRVVGHTMHFLKKEDQVLYHLTF